MPLAPVSHQTSLSKPKVTEDMQEFRMVTIEHLTQMWGFLSKGPSVTALPQARQASLGLWTAKEPQVRMPELQVLTQEAGNISQANELFGTEKPKYNAHKSSLWLSAALGFLYYPLEFDSAGMSGQGWGAGSTPHVRTFWNLPCVRLSLRGGHVGERGREQKQPGGLKSKGLNECWFGCTTKCGSEVVRKEPARMSVWLSWKRSNLGAWPPGDGRGAGIRVKEDFRENSH